MDVFDEKGQKLSHAQLKAQMEKICEMAPERIKVSQSVALMTSTERTPWAVLNKQLRSRQASIFFKNHVKF